MEKFRRERGVEFWQDNNVDDDIFFFLTMDLHGLVIASKDNTIILQVHLKGKIGAKGENFRLPDSIRGVKIVVK